MLTKLMPVALAAALAPHALATAKTAPSLIPLLQGIDVAAVDGGINPDAFAYQITAKVLVGANACDAKGARASLAQKTEGGTIEVTPMVKRSRKTRLCSRVWDPAYATVQLTVRGFRSQIDEVVVRNIGEYGTATSVEELLDQGQELSYTGVLSRVAAVGGESTGFALYLPTGESIELDLATSNLDRHAPERDGETVTVRGVLKTVAGIEIATRRVLEVTRLD